MNLEHFGMDTITLAGPLEAKLAAMRAAGFTQVMLNANDLAAHPGGPAAATEAVRRSGLRVTGFQVLRDFEGLSGHLHAYKVDIAKAMLEMGRNLGARTLLCCSSTSSHATGDPEALRKDLQKLAMLAVPYGMRIAYEALSWGRHVNEYTQAWEIVEEADRANLGLALDSFHMLATGSTPERLEELVEGEAVAASAGTTYPERKSSCRSSTGGKYRFGVGRTVRSSRARPRLPLATTCRRYSPSRWRTRLSPMARSARAVSNETSAAGTSAV